MIFNPTWMAGRSENMYGTYIIKDFYNNNFN